MRLISEVLKDAKEYIESAESFIEDHQYFSRDGGMNLAVNVKVYEWPDQDVLESLLKDFNDDEKAVVLSAINEHKSQYGESDGVPALWQNYLEDQAEFLVEYVKGCSVDVEYYRKDFKARPNTKTYRALRTEKVRSDMVDYCKESYFAGRSGGWFMFGHSDTLQIDEIQQILDFICDAEGKICEKDYVYLSDRLYDIDYYVEEGKKALKAFQHIAGYIKRAKDGLLKGFIGVGGELQYRIDEAMEEYYSCDVNLVETEKS